MKAPTLLAFVGLATAQAAEPTGTLTLACEGTVTVRITDVPDESEPISMGIVLNFTNGTVGGLPHIGTDPIKITHVDDLLIVLYHHYAFTVPNGWKGDWSLSGTIDRVTGNLTATSVQLNLDTKTTKSESYSLKCKPTQRMF
jgi:hypothetical protein